MKLTVRLWLHGAALPVAVLTAALGLSDRLFHLALERGVDQALLTQAAVESVSLFDDPRSMVHLHLSTTPLAESVRPFAPEATVFGPDGEEVLRYPPLREATPKERLMVALERNSLTMRYVGRGADRTRQLLVSVVSPNGQPYTLRLSSSTALLDRSIRTFHWVAFGSVALSAIVLVLLQLWQGRRLGARLRALHVHIEAVKAGDLDHTLEPEPESDELADLRGVLRDTTRQLRQTHDERERFLADAAHELRMPLTVMRTSLDLALRRERSVGELKQALRDAREEVDRLAELATRLLDALTVGKGKFERVPHDLVSIARDAVEAVREQADAAGVRVTLEASGKMIAEVHSGAIRQALDNLLSNAVRFAPPQTDVAVRVEEQGGHCELSVADQGPGIPTDEREAVFAPFHRARGARTGFGLGLTIVMDVARRHGGRAYVADTPRGATVVVELPRTVVSHAL